MAVTATPIYPQTIQSLSVQILPADTTTLKTLYTAGSNGSIIDEILVTNTDTAAAYAIQLSIVTSGTTYLLGTVNVPLSSGNTTAAAAISITSSLSAVLPRDANGNSIIYLGNGSVLKVNSTTTVNNSKIVSVTAIGGDY